MNKEAEQTFYTAVGNEVADRVVPGIDGITLDGFFTPHEIVRITHEYAMYLKTFIGTAPEVAAELEQEITESASTLYELQDEKFIDLEVPASSENDKPLFVTIGPDESPPDDEPDDGRSTL